MAPRKASASTAPGESVTASTPSPKSQNESDAAGHRNYLLAQTGLPADVALPVAKKGKSTKTTVTKPKSKIEDAVNVEGDGDGDGGARTETPRNAGPPKLKINLKRKASETPVTSSESPNSGESKYDSVANPTPKTKKPSKKRKVGTTEIATAPASALDDDNPITPTTPPAKKPATKKRKAAAVEDVVTSSSPDAKKRDEAAAPPNKKAKRVSTKSKDTAASKASSKAKGKKRDDRSDDTPPLPSAPARKELNFVVAAKVRRVQEFITTGGEGQRADFLERDPENPHHISVPELTLVGALMRMRVDYEIGDPYMAQLSDADSVILKRFIAPVLQTPDQPWVTIDARKRTPLEETIQAKIAGHGLEGYSLLDIELELLCRAQQPDPPSKVSAPAELQAFYDQTYKKVLDNLAREEHAALIADERGMLDLERNRGVCPLPMA